ncbi:MAG: DUF433 domain-containing protein [Candidatus Eremiobacterota bacterium]
MSLVATGYEHIVIGDDMVPMISGTTTKVVELVMEHIAYGWSPEEIHLQHPYLSLGKIYSALGYYWDHVEQLNQDIEQRMQMADKIQQEMKPSILKQRLKARGLK